METPPPPQIPQDETQINISAIQGQGITLTCKRVRIVHATDGAATEYHVVLCQRPCLVRKDILNLPQVFANVESTALEWSVRWGVVHVTVPVYEVDLNELDYLYGNVERDWDDDLKTMRDRKDYSLDTSRLQVIHKTACTCTYYRKLRCF